MITLKHWFKQTVAVLFLSMGFVACESVEDNMIEQVALDDVTLQSAADEAYANLLVEEASELGSEAISISLEGGRFERRALPECAEVTFDRPNRTITIDFGEGCTSESGRSRAGKILLTYASRESIDAGMSRTLTFDGYSVNGNAVEGVITHERSRNRSLGQQENSCTVEDFKVTFAEDQSSFTIVQSNRTRLWTRGEEGLTTLEVTGNANGNGRRGRAYSMTIVSPIIYKSGCMGEDRYYPVAGVRRRTIGQRPAARIDFGDGSCDNKATVTVGDRSREVTLRR